MEAFLIAGSNTYSGRTTASLLLALGLSQLGLDTLHIQVTASGEQPILQGEAAAPFGTAWFVANGRAPNLAEIKDRIGQSPATEAIVVDLPVSIFDLGWIADPAFRILLPMSTGSADVERVARDFHEIAGVSMPTGLALPWILPVGWPSAMRQSDYDPILRRVTRRLRLPAPTSDRVIQPGGIPWFDFTSEPLIVEGRTSLSSLRAKATEVIAYAMLKATGSALLEFPHDACWPEGM